MPFVGMSRLIAGIAGVGSVVAVLGALGCNGGSGGGSGSSSTAPPSVSPPTSSTNPPGPVTTATPPGPVTSGSSSAPVVAQVSYVDVNGNGVVDAGDQVVVKFSKEVRLSGTTIGDFVLPVTGDRFGSTATVTSGKAPTDVIITLSAGAVITVPGTFNASITKPGSPSADERAAAHNATRDVTGELAVPPKPVDVGGSATRPPSPPPPPPPL